jgi:hypothetical protein
MTSSPQTPTQSGLACNHVMRGKRPLVMIAHDEDGVWQFMCGKDDHSKAKQAKKVKVAAMFAKAVKGITQDEIPAGHVAERGKEGWAVRGMNDDERSQIGDVPPDPLGGVRGR